MTNDSEARIWRMVLLVLALTLMLGVFTLYTMRDQIPWGEILITAPDPTPEPTPEPTPTPTPAPTPEPTPTPKPLRKRTEFLTLVNPWHAMEEGYEPELQQVSWEYDNEQFVDVRCAEALLQMMADCGEAGGSPYICSAYRTMEKQQFLFNNKIARLVAEGVDPDEAPAIAARSVALPGTSEHQLGLAVDIIDINYPYLNETQETMPTQRWLMENSWRYGFILRYPNDKSNITGIIYEPWHFRYVGQEAAAYIKANDLCLEEFLALYGVE